MHRNMSLSCLRIFALLELSNIHRNIKINKNKKKVFKTFLFTVINYFKLIKFI